MFKCCCERCSERGLMRLWDYRSLMPSPEQDKLESVLDISHQQMEQYQDQPAHAEKIAYQQRLLQEDVVHIRADISQVSTVGRPTLHPVKHVLQGDAPHDPTRSTCPSRRSPNASTQHSLTNLSELRHSK